MFPTIPSPPNFFQKIGAAISKFLTKKVVSWTLAAATVITGVKGFRQMADMLSKGQDIMANKTAAGGKIPVIYGTRRVGAQIVYMDTAQNRSKDLFVVYAISVGECSEIVPSSIEIDGNSILDGNIYKGGGYVGSDRNGQTGFSHHQPLNTASQVGDVQYSNAGTLGTNPALRYSFVFNLHHGASSQTADPMLRASIPTEWTTNHKLNGICYIAAAFDYDKKGMYKGVPQITVQVKGKKVYDPRESDHTFGDPSTYEWSSNPALCFLDYITNDEYGKGLAESQINMTAIGTAADKCNTKVDQPYYNGSYQDVTWSGDSGDDFIVIDDNADWWQNKVDEFIDIRDVNDTSIFSDDITIKGSTRYEFYDATQENRLYIDGTLPSTYTNEAGSAKAQVKRFHCNGYIDTNKNVMDNAKELLANMRGILNYVNGKYELQIEDTGTSTFSITDDHIIADAGISVDYGNKDKKANKVVIEFFNANKKYELDTATVLHDATPEYYSDDGEVLEIKAEFPYVTDPYIAYNMGKAILTRSRNQTTMQFLGTPEMYKLNVGDIVDLTYSGLGFSGKVCRVEALELQANGLVSVSLIEYFDVYTWEVPAQESTEILAKIPTIGALKPPQASSIVFTDTDASAINRPTLTWTEPTDFPVRQYRVDVVDSSDNNVFSKIVDTPSVDLSFLPKGSNYEASITSFNGVGIESNASTKTFTIADDPVKTTEVEMNGVTLSTVETYGTVTNKSGNWVKFLNKTNFGEVVEFDNGLIVDSGTARFENAPTFVDGFTGQGTFEISQGSIQFGSYTPSTTTNRLYNVGGSLYWNGQALGTGTGDITAVVAGTNLNGGGTSGSVTLNLDSTITGDHTFSNNIIIQGNLTVQGTTTSVNTDDLNVKDKNITLNYSTGDSSASANGAGITIQDAVSATEDATLTWNTANDSFNFSHNLNFADNIKAQFGDSADLQIYHNGSNSYIDDAGQGALNIRSNGLFLEKYTGEVMITAIADGAVTLYHNNNAKLATTSSGIDISGNATFGDNEKAVFNSNLNIFSTGTSSYIEEVGTGDLYLKASNLYITDRENNQFMSMIDNGTGGTLSLKHLGSTVLTTTSTGIDITGTVTSDGLTVDGTISAYRAGFTQGVQLFGDSGGNQIIGTATNDKKLIIKNLAATKGIEIIAGNKVMDIARGGDIAFYDDTGSTQAFFWDASAESLCLGNTSAGAKFDIRQDSGYAIRAENNLGSYFRVAAGGNTEIGGNVTLSSTSPLLYLANTTSGTGKTWRFSSASNGKLYITQEGVIDAVTLDHTTGNATFAGTITGDGLTVSSTSPTLTIEDSDSTSTFNKTEIQNSSGTLNFNTRQSNGTFVSTDYQIFKNAAGANIHKWFIGGSEKARLDGSGNLLVGTTSTTPAFGTGNGTAIRTGEMSHISRSGGTALALNRASSDGDILSLRKDGTQIGSIGTQGGVIRVGSGNNNLGFFATRLQPLNSSGVGVDGTIDLGYSTSRFKDLRLSGNAYIGSSAYAQYFGSSADTNTLIQFAGSDDIRFRAGGTEQMRIKTTGVGIGTSNPAAELHINDATGLSAIRLTGGASSADNFQIMQGVTGVTNAGFSIYDIDATATRFVIDSSGNLLVGKTSSGALGTAGIELRPNNLYVTSTSGVPIYANRNTNDGDIIQLRKDNATVGSIGVDSTDNLYIAGGSGSTKGLYFNDAGVIPATTGGGVVNNAVDLGQSGYRFKDIWLSGTANFGSLSDGTITITGFVDQDDMSSDSATLLPTQQSVKAYVDANSFTINNNADNRIITGTATAGTLNAETTLTYGTTGADLAITGGSIGGVPPILRLEDVGSSGKLAELNHIAGTTTLISRNATSNGVIKFAGHNGTSETEYARIDSLGNVLVGTTSQYGSTGITLQQDGLVYARRTGVPSYLRRDGSDGDIIYMEKDGSKVGSIGSGVGDSSASTLYIADAGNVGIRFDQAATDDIQPCSSSGADRDNAINLGASDNRFKDLYLSGTIKLSTADNASNAEIFVSPSTDFAYFDHPSNGMIFRNTSGSERMRIDSSGRLGLGTSNPTYSLDVSSSSVLTGRIQSSSGETILELDNTNTNGRRFMIISGGNSGSLAGGKFGVFDATAGATRLAIDSSGNVGIGTASPDGNLEVVASSVIDSTSDTVNNVLIGLQAANRPTIVLDTADTTYTNRTWNITNVGAVGSLVIGRHGLDVLNLKNDGKVGIGTSSPEAKLHVQDNTTVIGNGSSGYATINFHSATTGSARYGSIRKNYDSPYDMRIRASNSTNSVPLIFETASNAERMRIDSSGNVGIGTSSPNALADLHVADTTDARIWLDATSGNTLELYAGSGVGLFNRSNNFLNFGTDNVERMRIDSSGNVGIGTTSPERPLHIASATPYIVFDETDASQKFSMGSGGGKFFLYDETDSAQRLTVDTSGNVGIGTTSPSYNLDLLASNAVSMIRTGDTTSPTLGLFVNSGSNGVGTISVDNGGHMTFDTGASGAGQAERMRIDSSGNLLVATTDTTLLNNTSGGGFSVSSNGFTQIAKQGVDSADPVLILNQTGVEGEILRFYKDGGIVGSIGSNSDALYISSPYGNDSGLRFVSGIIAPATTTGANRDAAIDLGYSSGRFKDLYLSGIINAAYNGGSQPNFTVDATGDVECNTFTAIGTAQIDGQLSSGESFSFTGGGQIRDAKTSSTDPILTVKNNSSTNTNGTYVDFLTNADSLRGSIGTRESETNTNLYIIGSNGTYQTGLKFLSFQSYRAIYPAGAEGATTDNTIDLGYSSGRFQDIYATNGTIQTSDKNEKQDIQALTEAEQRVATACKGLIRRFRWQDAVEKKDNNPDSDLTARYHFGVMAQDLQDAFEAEGLDAGDYGMFISSTWTDDDGNEQTRLGVRYNELLAFIITTL